MATPLHFRNIPFQHSSHDLDSLRFITASNQHSTGLLEHLEVLEDIFHRSIACDRSVSRFTPCGRCNSYSPKCFGSRRPRCRGTPEAHFHQPLYKDRFLHWTGLIPSPLSSQEPAIFAPALHPAFINWAFSLVSISGSCCG